jgi:molybdopterin converting factor subunit 1
MRVRVRLFARLREITGSGELERDVPGGASAGALWETLVRDFPELGAYTDTTSCAVNDEYTKRSTELRDGDEVAFLPPVSGGDR